MAKKGQRCEPGCQCGLHTKPGTKCQPGCTCGRHSALHSGPTPETAAKISAALRGRKRGPRSQETKDKIGQANRGRKHSVEFQEECRRLQVERWQDPEYRSRVTVAIATATGSEEYRAECAERQRLRWEDEEYCRDRIPAGGCPRGQRFDRTDAVGFYVNAAGYIFLTMQYDHPLASGNGVVGEHRKVLYDRIGPGPHLCHWNCGRSVDWGGWDGIHADHVDGNNQNNDSDNLVPSCYWCNRSGARLRA